MSGLVAEPAATTFFSGAGLADDLETLATDLRGGNWVSGGLMLLPTALDTMATAIDPIGSLMRAGIGWVLDHINPIKRWLNELTGDAAQVNANGQTAKNVAGELRRISSDIKTGATTQLADMKGDAKTSYQNAIDEITKAINGQADACDGLGESIMGAASIVTIVHGLVRDAFADIAASLISYLAELAITLGAATPLVIQQATSKAAAWAAKLGGKVTALVESCSKLATILGRLKGLFGKVKNAGDLVYGSSFMPQLKGEGVGAISKYNVQKYFMNQLVNHQKPIMINGMYGAHNSTANQGI